MNIIRFSLAMAASLLMFTPSAKAELVQTQESTPNFCEMAMDSWKSDCNSITLGLVSNYDTFNIKLCSTKGKYVCLILAGEAEELNNYPAREIKLFSVALQEGETIVRNFSGQLVLKPTKEGLSVTGMVENVPINLLFSPSQNPKPAI